MEYFKSFILISYMMGTNKFEYFDVTADIGLRVWGNTIDELFENAAIAVTSLMINPTKLERTITKEIFIEGNDISSLLINWITELLIIRDSEAILFSSFKVNVSSDGRSLTAKIFGNHIIGSDGKEVQPLEGEALDNAKYAAYKTWYEKVTSESKLETYDNWIDLVPSEPVFTPVQPQPTATVAPEAETNAVTESTAEADSAQEEVSATAVP